MSDQILLLAARLTVLFPEPVGPMTLGDINLDNSLLRSLSRTLSRYHSVQSPLGSPLQELRWSDSLWVPRFRERVHDLFLCVRRLSESIVSYLLEDKNEILLLYHFSSTLFREIAGVRS